jgi:hypothetical protein
MKNFLWRLKDDQKDDLFIFLLKSIFCSIQIGECVLSFKNPNSIKFLENGIKIKIQNGRLLIFSTVTASFL